MNLTGKLGASLAGVMNLLAACGAFVIWGIYVTFAQWGADGWFYLTQVALIGAGVVVLLVCAGTFWWKRRSQSFAATALASSLTVLFFALLVFFPTIHSRHNSDGFVENMVWLTAPMIILLLNSLISYFKLLQAKAPEVTSWPH
jgi:hypothetical protein